MMAHVQQVRHLVHPWQPVWKEDAKVLILGTFPSEGSVKYGGPYGHRTNQFWRLMTDVLDGEGPHFSTGSCRLDIASWDRRFEVLRRFRIALWDVVKECDREGPSSDTKLKKVVPNDFEGVFGSMPKVRINGDLPELELVAFTGTKAADLFSRLVLPLREESLCIPVVVLPSPSAANPLPYADKLAAYRRALSSVLQVA